MMGASFYGLDVRSVHPAIARFLDGMNVTSLVRTDIEPHTDGTIIVVQLGDAVEAQVLVQTASAGVVLTIDGRAFEGWLFDEGGASGSTVSPDVPADSSGHTPSSSTTMLHQRWWVAGPVAVLLIALLVLIGVSVAQKQRRRGAQRLDTPVPPWQDALHVTASYGDEESHLGDAPTATRGSLTSVRVTVPPDVSVNHTSSPITRATTVKVSPWAPNHTTPAGDIGTRAGAEPTEDATPPGGYVNTLDARQEEMVHIRRQLDLHFQTSPKKDRYYTTTDL